MHVDLTKIVLSDLVGFVGSHEKICMNEMNVAFLESASLKANFCFHHENAYFEV